MRRTLAALAAVAAFLSALVIPAGTAASAPAGSLTVITLDRHGQPARASAVLINRQTDRERYVTSGHAIALPNGRYLVLVSIRGLDGSVTVGARAVTVDGTAQVTFRARFGQPVRAVLDPVAPNGYSKSFYFAVCDTQSFAEIFEYAAGGDLYALPSAVRSVQFAFSATWAPVAEGAGMHFMGSALRRDGIPAGATLVVHRSALAKLQVTARRGPQAGHARIELDGDTRNHCRQVVQRMSVDAYLPTSFTAYLPPGTWLPSQDAQDFMVAPARHLRLGHPLRMVLDRAAWGPTGPMPYSWLDRRLYISPTQMFTDPTMTTYPPYADIQYKLRHGGQTLFSTTVRGNTSRSLVKRLPEPGWYTLVELAKRPAARLFPGALSPRSELRLHFYSDLSADRQIRGYITQFLPSGLDLRNRAAPGSHTTVVLRPRNDRNDTAVSVPADAVRSVLGWWSGDRGRTWHAATVVHRNGAWSMVVPNPDSGRVSLRAKVFDTHSGWSLTGVTDAYAIR